MSSTIHYIHCRSATTSSLSSTLPQRRLLMIRQFYLAMTTYQKHLHLRQGLNKKTNWLQKWRIRASATKSFQVTFSLKKGNYPPVQLENVTLPHQDKVRYLGLHLDRRLNWKDHIKSKREELKLRYKGL